MKNPCFRSAALGTAAVLVLLAVIIFNRTTVSGYAVDQTLEALQAVRTVHFRASLFRQGGPMACWMEFIEGDRRPSRMVLRVPGRPLRKVDGPDGSFTFNEETGRFLRVPRDERRQDWYPDFTGFFEDALARTDKGRVEIGVESDSEHGKEWISATFREPLRDWRVLVDPDTKLPHRVDTLEVRDRVGLIMQRPIVVESMDGIEYNLPVPKHLFVLPEDAEEVTEEIDVIVHRGLGMPVGDRSPEEACRALVEDVVSAMQAMDWDRVKQLYLPFMTPPPELLAQMKKVAEETGRPLIELVEVGEPYRDGAYWFVPHTAREADGTMKDDPVRIRFYTLDGEDYCIIAMPNL